eukprot:scaffold33364_cov146-Isochrysis_galbana.AAC.3
MRGAGSPWPWRCCWRRGGTISRCAERLAARLPVAKGGSRAPILSAEAGVPLGAVGRQRRCPECGRRAVVGRHWPALAAQRRSCGRFWRVGAAGGAAGGARRVQPILYFYCAGGGAGGSRWRQRWRPECGRRAADSPRRLRVGTGVCGSVCVWGLLMGHACTWRGCWWNKRLRNNAVN